MGRLDEEEVDAKYSQQASCSLFARTVSGDIVLREQAFTTLTVATTSRDMDLESVRADSFEMNITSGDFRAETLETGIPSVRPLHFRRVKSF